MAQLVVKVAHLLSRQVVSIDGDLGGIAQQVAGKAGGAGAGTQDGVLHVDARALVQDRPVSSSAIQLSSSVCVQVTLTVAYSWAHTRSTDPTTLGRQRESPGQ